MNKVAIIGHFGGKEQCYDGQTVKTKNLEQLLAGCPDIVIRRVDTYYAKCNKVKLLWDTLKALLLCRHIFLLVSVKGMQVFLPLLHYLNRLTKRRIYHYVIGSELLEMVERDPSLVGHLNSFEANWFEYESGTERLRKLGVTNVVTVPNFKDIVPIAQAEPYPEEKRMYTFCTFSRVLKEKGITEAIQTIDRLNQEQDNRTIVLDIYGPVDDTYKEEFEGLRKRYASCVNYKGVVDSQKSVEVLKDYYALLFPTYWPGEGLPGTVIDAFAAGLPVIASDWNANKEIIQHGKQGLVYPAEGLATLYDAVRWSLDHSDEMNGMRRACREQFELYRPETVLHVIRRAMDGDK